jgi:hypothetical protein
VWSYDCRADGSGTNSNTNATTHIGPMMMMDAATIDAADAHTASAISASIRHGVRRNTRDAKNGRCSDGSDRSIRHEISFLRLRVQLDLSEAQCQAKYCSKLLTQKKT